MYIFFSILVLSVITTNCTYFRMKVEVNRVLPEAQKISWWVWTNDAGRVAKKHRELYPDSMLWLIGRSSDLVVIGLMVGLLIITLVGKA